MLTMLLAIALQSPPFKMLKLPELSTIGLANATQQESSISHDYLHQRQKELLSSIKQGSNSATNLESWMNRRLSPSVDTLVPKTAISYSQRNVSAGILAQPIQHYPWHVAIQRHWPQYYGEETYLSYQIVAERSVSNANYEGIVVNMPNIRSKAKTLPELEERLLQQYSAYLQSLMEDSSSQARRTSEVIFGESWLATLPGKSEIKLDMPQGPVFSAQYDFSQSAWVQFGY